MHSHCGVVVIACAFLAHVRVHLVENVSRNELQGLLVLRSQFTYQMAQRMIGMQK